MKGASTLAVEELQCAALYATEVASPVLAGAAVSTAEELQSVALYANEFASPRRR